MCICQCEDDWGPLLTSPLLKRWWSSMVLCSLSWYRRHLLLPKTCTYFSCSALPKNDPRKEHCKIVAPSKHWPWKKLFSGLAWTLTYCNGCRWHRLCNVLHCARLISPFNRRYASPGWLDQVLWGGQDLCYGNSNYGFGCWPRMQWGNSSSRLQLQFKGCNKLALGGPVVAGLAPYVSHMCWHTQKNTDEPLSSLENMGNM